MSPTKPASGFLTVSKSYDKPASGFLTVSKSYDKYLQVSPTKPASGFLTVSKGYNKISVRIRIPGSEQRMQHASPTKSASGLLTVSKASNFISVFISVWQTDRHTVLSTLFEKAQVTKMDSDLVGLYLRALLVPVWFPVHGMQCLPEIVLLTFPRYSKQSFVLQQPVLATSGFSEKTQSFKLFRLFSFFS